MFHTQYNIILFYVFLLLVYARPKLQEGMDVVGISLPATTVGVRTERGLDEEIHEPAKCESSHNHNQEEGKAVADLCFFITSSN